MWIWIISALLLLGIIAAIPAAMRWVRRNAKGNAAGFILGVGAMFATLFDPAKTQATEELDRTKRTGGAKQQESGDSIRPKR